ncbi:MAG: TadE/TadG family protein [Nitrospirales bacterium]|nr:TadE/TadG family protein [Nitrospira sp.]MDR4500984.1 TadE/TadG family protein [Nitrospirales bacterium]
MCRHLHNQKGGFLILGAIFIALLFGFAALGIEVGRWFAVKAEMAKAVDAASLAGATHFTNPNIQDKQLFIQRMAQANFYDGILGTDEYTTFTVTTSNTGKVTINGQANVLNTVSKALFSAGTVPVAALGAARLGGAEIGLVLDVSGSMYGTPISDLKSAAKQFLDNFEDTEDRNKFGLVAFAHGAEVRYPLQDYYYNDLAGTSGYINALTAVGGTNTEYALERAKNDLGYTDQTGVPDDERLDQYIIFISDGNPTAFTGSFTRDGNEIQAVAYASSDSSRVLYDPNMQSQSLGIAQYETGDGLPVASTACTGLNTKWHVFSDPVYGMTNYNSILGTSNPIQCGITRGNIKLYVDEIIKQMAIDHATEIKNQGILIYSIGFGGMDLAFLNAISSGPEYTFPAASSSELQDLLQIIANRLKLRLLE